MVQFDRLTGTVIGMSPHPGRGRIDKRQKIMDAAFAVFAREGYPQAKVDQIAAEAAVAKATVYNHFGDKQTLFREAITALCDHALARNLAAVETLADPGDDLGAAFADLGERLIDCYCADESRALRRLLYAEFAQFPDLLELTQNRVSQPIARALADRLARLALAGRLRTPDPALAAEQLTALLTAPVEARSRFGTRRISRRERGTVAEAAAATFLSVYGPR